LGWRRGRPPRAAACRGGPAVAAQRPDGAARRVIFAKTCGIAAGQEESVPPRVFATKSRRTSAAQLGRCLGARPARLDLQGWLAVLELKGISKHCGAIEALSQVNFLLDPGEIVGLMGDNGAGKSTLVKIMAGNFPPSAGEMLLEGRAVQFHKPVDARAAGI